MNNLFLALLLLSLLGLVVGLINPSAVRLKSRSKVGLYFGVATILFFVLFGVTTHPTQQAAVATSAVTQTTQSPVVQDKVQQTAAPQNPTQIVGASGYTPTNIPLSYNGYLALPNSSGVIAAGMTYSNEDQLTSLSIAGDTVGIAKMVQEGSAYALAPNTQIKVIDVTYASEGTYEVRIMSGQYYGDAAWLPGEFISSTTVNLK